MEDESFDHPEHDGLDDHNSNTDDHGSSRAGSKEALLPVTLRQVLAATPVTSETTTPWNIGGRQVKKILVVATVIEEHHKPEAHTAWYKLIDGTNGKSVMAFRYMHDVLESALPLPPFEGVVLIPEHRYVCISGSLSAMRGGGTAIRVDGFHVIQDYHELCTHRLQVMAAALTLQRGPPPATVLQNLSNAVKYPSVQDPPQLVNRPTSTQDPASQSQLPNDPPPAPDARPNQSSESSRPPHGIEAGASKNTSYKFESSSFPKSPTPERHSTPPRVDKGKQRERAPRRFSMEDPLSDLTPEQRTILLKIMEGTNADTAAGLNVVQLAVRLKTEDGIEDINIITHGLDILVEKGHIITDSEGLMYKAISKKTMNMYPMDID
ncbi:hypothetical protein PHLGIDRAFT_126284 [Phlebiopsis gigantea 11061_1 CR5-6]|uniref:Replication protein A C-terminal domain-containing protein n=1 Tax=Phlebiopsis gigantea (strain 11061_1 CR5-6) TaxID=745531 RepID=A0A0C3NVW4_PHLG1|nr:hypothetical protein PHLGIDRAFT_126284 [Phlebiopsis gigantea 11061_1 CR5-6]